MVTGKISGERGGLERQCSPQVTGKISGNVRNYSPPPMQQPMLINEEDEGH